MNRTALALEPKVVGQDPPYGDLNINSETNMAVVSVAGEGEGEKMDKKNKVPATVLVALIWVAALQGCASTSEPVPTMSPSQAASPASESVTASKEILTVENLLRWPLEGKAGTSRLTNALNQLFDMELLQASQLSGNGPVQLADGYVLSFAWIRKLSGDIDVGVASEPCLTPAMAAKITDAELEPVFQDAHGVDRGRQYRVTRNGMTLRFNTTPVSYKCVTAIHSYPEQGS
jgi:hypothetical protein